IHDSQVLIPLMEKLRQKYLPEVVVMDAGYKTPAIAHYLWGNQMEAVLPYTRPRGKEGFFTKRDFMYDAWLNAFHCPNNHLLSYVRLNREGYYLYKSNPTLCEGCTLRTECTESRVYEKSLTRHLWEADLERSEDLRHTERHKAFYKKRKETIERCFADAKEKHGMRYATYRGLAKVTLQATLTYTAMNLKKLALWTWKKSCSSSSFFILRAKNDNPVFFSFWNCRFSTV
ncbi:transposase, partial [Listeria floridensis]|uniref:transposase n=1 Tax=Listeria floridensis TaxID=1494962 RepID=UPI00056D3E29